MLPIKNLLLINDLGRVDLYLGSRMVSKVPHRHAVVKHAIDFLQAPPLTLWHAEEHKQRRADGDAAKDEADFAL